MNVCIVLEENIGEYLYILKWSKNFLSMKLKEEITKGETSTVEKLSHKIKKGTTMKNTCNICEKEFSYCMESSYKAMKNEHPHRKMCIRYEQRYTTKKMTNKYENVHSCS